MLREHSIPIGNLNVDLKTYLSKLTIVYVWDADYPWDVRTEKTCLALTRAGHDVHIVARNREHCSLTQRLPEATVHRMPPWSWAGHKLDAVLSFPAFFNPRWRSLIANTASMVKADVIIVRDIPLCPTAISVGHGLHVPVILDLAEHYPAMMRALWQTGRQRPFDWLLRNPVAVEWVEQFSLRNVDHIFTVAQEMTDRLIAMDVTPSRITRVRNTPCVQDRPFTRKASKCPDDPIQIVYLGLLEVARGINDIIDAVALLRGGSPRFSLLLIGSGRDEQLFRDRADAKGLTIDDVTFAGQIPHTHAVELMAEADIAVLPLHRNPHMDTTLPNKLFDYMSAGLPVVTSDTIPSARVVREEDAGVVFKAQDVTDLVVAISSLGDPATRSKMGANGRAAVDRRYNWQNDESELLLAVQRVRADWAGTFVPTDAVTV